MMNQMSHERTIRKMILMKRKTILMSRKKIPMSRNSWIRNLMILKDLNNLKKTCYMSRRKYFQHHRNSAGLELNTDLNCLNGMLVTFVLHWLREHFL
jgi:hypothetical protein